MAIGNSTETPSTEDRFKPYREYLNLIHKSLVKCRHYGGKVVKWNRGNNALLP